MTATAVDERRLPIHTALDAFEGWQRRPGPASRRRLGAAVGAIVAAAGASGGYLIVEAPPLPRVEVGAGSLSRRPTRAPRSALHDVELSADEGRVRLGHLWIDPGDGDGRDVRAELAASAVGAAVDAAWSRARARAAMAELAALDAATRGIASVLSVDRVLQLIVDRVRELVSAQYAALGLVDQEGRIERFITSGITRGERERIGPPPEGHGLLGLIITEGQTLRIPDVMADPRAVGFPPNHPEMHSLLGVPVTVKGRPVGDLYLTNKRGDGEFSADDERLVEMFALHAGIAIENARLHEQVQRLVVVEERERIGRDLHDGIIQSIYAVGLSLEDVPELMEDEPNEAKARVERAIESLDTTIRDIRNFIFGLRPELLEQAGLVGGLAALEDEFRVNTLVDVEMSTDGFEEGELAAEETAELLSIAREALSNVARHAKATRAVIELQSDEEAVSLQVADNGVGFEPERPRGIGHQGLQNMRSRAASIDASFRILSRPGSGTRIIVRVPRRKTPPRSKGEE